MWWGRIIRNVPHLVSLFRPIGLHSLIMYSMFDSSKIEILLWDQTSRNLAMGQEKLLYCEEWSLETSHIWWVYLDQLDCAVQLFFVFNPSFLGNLQLYHSDFCAVSRIIKTSKNWWALFGPIILHSLICFILVDRKSYFGTRQLGFFWTGATFAYVVRKDY